MAIDRDSSVGFVHAGRLGASLAVAMGKAGYPVRLIGRRDAAAARSVARRIPGATATNDVNAVVEGSDIVFLTCVDSAIEDLAGRLPFHRGQAVVHCSGATPLRALAAARARGAETGGIHPLQTFPDEYGEARFAGVTFGVEAEGESLSRWLAGLVSDLEGGLVWVSDASRAVYHASAVMVGPLFAGLVGLAADLWVEMGVGRSAALRALAPLFSSTADQLVTLGVPTALTGPFVRGDHATVSRHLDALGASGREDVLLAYARLALAQLPIAAEQGKISDDARRTLERLLETAASVPGEESPPGPPQEASRADEENDRP